VTVAVVLGAGRGTRLGVGVAKGLRPLCGTPLLHYSLFTIESCGAIDATVVVVPARDLEAAKRDANQLGLGKPIIVIAGGDRRQDSVQLALAACPSGTEWVAVHDAARPFASSELFLRTIECAQKTGGAIVAVPVADTIKRAHDHRVVESLPREELWAAETPQVFRLADLQAALSACATSGHDVTDDAAAMEFAGYSVSIVPGDGSNFKISTPADWVRAERQLAGSG